MELIILLFIFFFVPGLARLVGYVVAGIGYAILFVIGLFIYIVVTT